MCAERLSELLRRLDRCNRLAHVHGTDQTLSSRSRSSVSCAATAPEASPVADSSENRFHILASPSLAAGAPCFRRSNACSLAKLWYIPPRGSKVSPGCKHCYAENMA